MTVGELTDTLARMPRDLEVTVEVLGRGAAFDASVTSEIRLVVCETTVAPDMAAGPGTVILRGW